MTDMIQMHIRILTQIYFPYSIYMTSSWTNHVKAYAKDKGITYKSALQDPQCSASYKANKAMTSATTEEKQHEGNKPKRRGRPRKYHTVEEAKVAKTSKTIESNKRKRKISKPDTNESIENKPVVQGTGVLSVGYVAENANGLGHIYPITHELVLRMINENGM
jgi:uncharacterized protein YktA (UPF0223 family)